MCHQTVCLIARHIERLGIPTFIAGAALDILKAGNPPRATFIDFPLGFSTGKLFDPENQLAVLRESLTLHEHITESGTIVPLSQQWPEGWQMKKHPDQENTDERASRDMTPRYQTEEDRLLAEQRG